MGDTPARADEISSICSLCLDFTRVLMDIWFTAAHIAISSNWFGHGYSSNGAFINRSTVEIGL